MLGLTTLLAAELLLLPNHHKFAEPNAEPPSASATDDVESGDNGAAGFALAMTAGVRVAAAATAHAAVLTRNLFTRVDISSPNLRSPCEVAVSQPDSAEVVNRTSPLPVNYRQWPDLDG